jgi:polar amino acid transport system permease protein
MNRSLFKSPAVQYSILFAILAAMIYYWGFVFDFGYKFQWDVLYTENETYGVIFGLKLLEGLRMTIHISLISSAIALGLGIFFGLGRISSFKPYYTVSTVFVEFFRNTPLLIQLFFWYFAMPMGLPESWREFVFAHDFEFWSATIGLSVYTASFMAEVIRAGIQSIPRGLLEAAYSSGLTYTQALRTIILPLAFRAIIPPLGSEFLNNMKNSSLAMVVGVAELCWQAQQLESLTFRGFEATTAASVLYLGLSLVISWVLNLINTRLRIPDNHTTFGWDHALATILFLPFERLWKLLAMPFSLFRKNGNDLHYTRAGLIRKRIMELGLQGVILAGKGTFVAGVGFLLFKCGQGLFAFEWSVVWTNLPTLLIWRFPNGSPNEVLWGLGGFSYSILMAVIAISVSFFIGLVVGLGRMSENRIFRIPCLLYIEIIRGNPLILVIFWVYFFLPIFTGAYLAEIVRGGIQNIPRGQFEAAFGTGLGYYHTMTCIILPQALKQMIPAIVGQFIAIFKDTSLAFVIGVLELTFVAQGLNNRIMVHPFEIYTTVAALYFIFCYSLSIVARRLERKLTPESARISM